MPLTVRGSSSTDEELTVNGVSVRATGVDFDSGQVAATADEPRFASWSAPIDLSSAGARGSRFIATLSMEGGRTYTDEITVSTYCWTPGSFSDDLEPTPNAGWTFDAATNADPDSPTWAHVTDGAAHSATHSFTSDAQGGDQLGLEPGNKDDRLVAPVQSISSGSTVEFWHRFNTEGAFDGGFLEVSADDGSTWTDILEAGGTFTEGGYNGSIGPTADVPTAGRQAWTGTNGAAMTRVIADLGPLAPADLLVRFRLVTDIGTFPEGAGWWVDDASITQTSTEEACNQAPTATDDTAAALQGATIQIDLLENDSDPDVDDLTITSVDSPTEDGGTVAIADDGFVSYTAPATPGIDHFDYTVSDGRGGTDVGTVTVEVTAPPNTAPVATDDTATVADGEFVTIDLLDNDTDADGDELTVTSISATEDGGVVTDNGDGTVLRGC